MKVRGNALKRIVVEAAKEWQADNAMRLSASLAYYTVFSLAPLLLAAISISSLIYGEEAARGQVFSQLQGAIGSSAASAVQDLALAASQPANGVPAAMMALGLALFGASGVFGELKASLNEIWGVKPPESGGILAWIRGRFLSIGMVMGVCFLLLVSMGISTVLSRIAEVGPGDSASLSVLLVVLNQLISIAVISALFSAMFRYLPATRIAWRDVVTGGVFTAVLFVVGKTVLEQYVSRASPASSFGTAKSLALVLVWVYYSAQIFLFGAEFTEVYARREGTRKGLAAPRHRAEKDEPLTGTSGVTALAPVSRSPDTSRPSLAKTVAGLVILGLVSFLRRGRRDS